MATAQWKDGSGTGTIAIIYADVPEPSRWRRIRDRLLRRRRSPIIAVLGPTTGNPSLDAGADTMTIRFSPTGTFTIDDPEPVDDGLS